MMEILILMKSSPESTALPEELLKFKNSSCPRKMMLLPTLTLFSVLSMEEITLFQSLPKELYSAIWLTRNC